MRYEGKIRFYGLAFATPSQALSTLRERGLSTLQLPISVGAPAAVDEILAWARKRDLGVIANQPLRKGALLHPGVASKWASARREAVSTPAQTASSAV